MGKGQILASACLKCGHMFYNCTCVGKAEPVTSPLDDLVSRKVAGLEKAKNLCGEIIATLDVNIQRGHLPETLEPIVKGWRDKLRSFSG